MILTKGDHFLAAEAAINSQPPQSGGMVVMFVRHASNYPSKVLSRTYQGRLEQSSGESIRRLDPTQPNENATRALSSLTHANAQGLLFQALGSCNVVAAFSNVTLSTDASAFLLCEANAILVNGHRSPAMKKGGVRSRLRQHS